MTRQQQSSTQDVPNHSSGKQASSSHHGSESAPHADDDAKSGQHDYSTHISDDRAATTLKYNQVFLLTDSAGDITPQDRGNGLYFRDMRYLDRMEILVQGRHCLSLVSDVPNKSEAVFELTNPQIALANGHALAKEQLSIRRVLTLGPEIVQRLDVRNFSQDSVAFDLSVSFVSAFDDMFAIRGRKPAKRGVLREPLVTSDTVVLAYDGADAHVRTTTLRFSPAPDQLNGSEAVYHLTLAARAVVTLTVGGELSDRATGDGESANDHTHQSGAENHQRFTDELARVPDVETSNQLFDRALRRSLEDIRLLATANHDDLYLAAGVPWYVALFGRDSCISAFETLAFHPALAKSTLLLLARYQGTKDDAFQDEEPGKIMHELRLGEMANLREVPMIPYYGTVDATPWFLMLLAEYVRWTGDLALFRHVRQNVERALAWIDATERDPLNIPGFLNYGSRSEKGLRNQGWKDSNNAIVNADGSLCRPPIALVEVQGYAYKARIECAQLFRQVGDERRADELEQQAAALKQRFDERYWLDDLGYYALCLERDGQPSRAIASNPGQTLFTRIIADEHVKPVAERLLCDDMFCGWGIRTLSSDERAYNPLDYQVGSIWPHDNALIALGLRRWGLKRPMARLFTGLFQAAQRFAEQRLPEVFDGFGKQQYPNPVHYPVACSPQAWASGAIPLLVQTALGLEPDAVHQRLLIDQPYLPEWLAHVTLRGLRVGAATVDLHYQRDGERTHVDVMSHTGTLQVQTQI